MVQFSTSELQWLQLGNEVYYQLKLSGILLNFRSVKNLYKTLAYAMPVSFQEYETGSSKLFHSQ